VTVTLKKNTVVQAELKADKIKYMVKRDLSGDVQWTNMASVGNLSLAGITESGVPYSTTGTTNAGWNFVKFPKVSFSASRPADGPIGFKMFIRINNVVKTSTTTTTFCTPGACTLSGTWTPAPRSITSAAANPNTIKFQVSATMFPFVTAAFKSNMQRNDKTTVMATT